MSASVTVYLDHASLLAFVFLQMCVCFCVCLCLCVFVLCCHAGHCDANPADLSPWDGLASFKYNLSFYFKNETGRGTNTILCLLMFLIWRDLVDIGHSFKIAHIEEKVKDWGIFSQHGR